MGSTVRFIEEWYAQNRGGYAHRALGFSLVTWARWVEGQRDVKLRWESSYFDLVVRIIAEDPRFLPDVETPPVQIERPVAWCTRAYGPDAVADWMMIIEQGFGGYGPAQEALGVGNGTWYRWADPAERRMPGVRRYVRTVARIFEAGQAFSSLPRALWPTLV